MNLLIRDFRDTNFDLNTLDALQSRIMGLREKRGIGVFYLARECKMTLIFHSPPSYAGRARYPAEYGPGAALSRACTCCDPSRNLRGFETPGTDKRKTAHWAQQIFSLPLPSRTSLKATKKYATRQTMLRLSSD